MTTGADLAADYARNTWIIMEQAKGLDHADSLDQPTPVQRPQGGRSGDIAND